MTEYKRTNQKKTWVQMKGKQKDKLNKNIYRKFLEYYLINAHMPTVKETKMICINKYEGILSQSIWIEYEKFEKYFYKKIDNYEERIVREIENGMTLEKLNYKMPKKTEKQKMAERRKQRKIRKAKKKEKELYDSYQDQDEAFYYIAGYTSGGVPYGTTWEEMELKPFDELKE